MLQNCFRIKIIGPLRSQKSLCNGRCRRCERRQGRRPSLAGYQENFLASAEAVRDAGQVWPGTPGELRRRPEISEGIRDAGRTPQKPVPGNLRRWPQPPRGLGRRQGRRPNTSKARTRQSSQAAAAAPRPRKASKHAAERFRGLGKLQNTPLNVSEASEAPKHAAERFRGLGKHQNAPLNVSEASEGLKHAAERFRGLGRHQGRRPSLAGYQENFLASAEAVRDAG